MEVVAVRGGTTVILKNKTRTTLMWLVFWDVRARTSEMLLSCILGFDQLEIRNDKVTVGCKSLYCVLCAHTVCSWLVFDLPVVPVVKFVPSRPVTYVAVDLNRFQLSHYNLWGDWPHRMSSFSWASLYTQLCLFPFLQNFVFGCKCFCN